MIRRAEKEIYIKMGKYYIKQTSVDQVDCAVYYNWKDAFDDQFWCGWGSGELVLLD